jgi:hypothetical protein
MDQQHDSKVVRWFCAAVAILAVRTVAAAVIHAVGEDKTPSVTVMAPQQPQLQPSGASVVYLGVSPGIKAAPDGQLHDTYNVTDFNVHVGGALKL